MAVVPEQFASLAASPTDSLGPSTFHLDMIQPRDQNFDESKMSAGNNYRRLNCHSDIAALNHSCSQGARMLHSPTLLLRLSVTWLFLIFIAGCQDLSTTSPTPATSRIFAGQYPIKVVCTTGPVADMVRNLGGSHLDVTGLMGPGVDPHLYTAVPADIERLWRADMIFYNGLHLEGRMADQFDQLAKRRPTFAVTHSLVDSKDPRLRKPPEFDGYYDPHVWHDPRLWADCVKYVCHVLSEFDPAHREDYVRNRDSYLAQLEQADRYCREQLQTIPPEQRVLISTHDAFGYFCIAYGFTSMPLKGVSTDDEVSIGRMEEVAEFLVSRKIKAVFVETATSPQLMQALIERCRRSGHEVRNGGALYADALGPAESGANTYVGMIKANVDTIVSALK
jgi:manganese/zinc/iron transport system substrate-binding protein